MSASTESTRGSVAIGFHEMAVQFVEASAAAWPEDPLLPIAVAQIKGVAPEVLIDAFATAFKDQLDGLSRRDPEALFAAGQHPGVAALDIRGKYESSNDNTKETLWTYMGHLCRFVSVLRLYKSMPTRILDAAQDTAKNLKQQLDSGVLTASAINPFELGQQVMAKFAPEDLESMMKDMMSNPEIINTVMSQMGSLLPPDAAAAAAAGVMPPGMPNLDLSALTKMFGRP